MDWEEARRHGLLGGPPNPTDRGKAVSAQPPCGWRGRPLERGCGSKRADRRDRTRPEEEPAAISRIGEEKLDAFDEDRRKLAKYDLHVVH